MMCWLADGFTNMGKKLKHIFATTKLKIQPFPSLTQKTKQRNQRQGCHNQCPICSESKACRTIHKGHWWNHVKELCTTLGIEQKSTITRTGTGKGIQVSRTQPREHDEMEYPRQSTNNGLPYTETLPRTETVYNNMRFSDQSRYNTQKKRLSSLCVPLHMNRPICLASIVPLNRLPPPCVCFSVRLIAW